MSQAGTFASGGGPVPPTVVETLTGNTGVATASANNINVVAAVGSGSFSGAGDTLTYTLPTTVPEEFVTDAGTATPALGILDILGAHNINTSGAGNTVTVHGNNTITVGDLASVAGSDAITVTTGNVTVTAGNIHLPFTNTAGSIGEIQFGGHRWLSTFGGDDDNTFVGADSGNTTNTGLQCVGIGQESLLSLTSGIGNNFLGTVSGVALTSGSFNIGIGGSALGAITTPSYNVGVGPSVGVRLTTGAYNLLLGSGQGAPNSYTGYQYTGAESSNILLNNLGVLGESNTMRLGTTGTGNGEVSTAYIAGTYGVTPAVSGTNQMVISNNVGQLGTQAIPSVNVIPITTVNHAASPYTVLTTDRYLSVDVSGGVVTILMPNAPVTGQIYTIKDSVGLSGVNNITVTTVGGAVTIDGATSLIMNTPFEAINLIFDGASFEIY